MRKLIDRLKKSPLFKDSFWALFGSFIGKGLSVLAGILVARFLGRDIYGEYGVLQSTLIQIGMFSTFGLGYTATKYVAEYNNSRKGQLRALISLLLWITFFSSLILSILVFAFSEPIAMFIKAPQLAYPIRLCSVVVILNGLTLTQIGVLSGLNSYKTIARNNTLSGILAFILCCCLTYPLGFNGALYSLLISQLFNYGINRFSIERKTSEYIRLAIPRLQLIRSIVSFSFPVALQESCVFAFGWLMTYSLIRYSNYGEVGLHSAAAQWSAIILFVPGVLRNVTLSHLSGDGNDQRHKKIMRVMMLTNFVASALPYLATLILNPVIVRAYGPSYMSLGIVMVVLNASTIPNCLSNVYVQEFMAINRNWYVFFTRFLKDAMGLCLAIYLMTRANMTGALSVSISVLTTSTLYFFALLTIYKFIKRKRKTI